MTATWSGARSLKGLSLILAVTVTGLTSCQYPTSFTPAAKMSFRASTPVKQDAVPGDQATKPGETPENGCRYDPAVSQLSSPPDVGQANYLHTCGNRIYDERGQEFLVIGVNWFGIETPAFSPRGLGTRNWEDVLNEIVAKGYNTIRLPYSNEALQPNSYPNAINYDLNPDLRGLTALQLMDKIIEGAGKRELRVILDRHRPTSYGQSPLWYTESVSEQRWIDDWKMLAQRYLGNDTVIGVDLHNEPQREATWGTGDIYTDWRLAAERAGNAVLDVNPYLLIFVQGIAFYQGDYYWWGAQLRPAGEFPVSLNVSNRLVYSPRDYGPEVYEQPYFRDPKFPANLPDIWESHWGYLHTQGIAPVVLGEFDGPSLGDDMSGKWQKMLLRYLFINRMGFVVWHLNANVWDQPGSLTSQWAVFAQQNYNLAKAYLLPPSFNSTASGVVKSFGQQ